MARAFTPHHPRHGKVRRQPILGHRRALWLFLLALLFGAAAPLGPPETLIHGPAFNPATTSAALAAKRLDQGNRVEWRRGTRRDGYAGAAEGSAVPAFRRLPPAVAALAATIAYPGTATPTNRPQWRGTLGARAPPELADRGAVGADLV